MATQIITFNEESVDLNTLFSFDLLKRTIEYLIMNQKVTNERIIDLETKVSKIQTVPISSKEELKNNRENKKDEEKIKSLETIKSLKSQERILIDRSNLKEMDEKINDTKIIDNEERLSLEKEVETQIQNNFIINVDDPNQLSSKIASIDTQLKQFKFFRQDILDLYQKHENCYEIVRSHDQTLSDVRQQQVQTDYTLEGLKLKIEDFNIFDIIKGKSDSKDEGPVGDSNQLMAILQNLERKVFKKFDLVDEKIKGFQDEIYKKKNEILTIMTTIETGSKQTNSSLEAIIRDINDKHNILNNLINTKEKELKNNLMEEVATLNDFVNTKFKELSSNFVTQSNLEKNQEEVEKEIDKNKQGMTESDLKLIKDLTKRVNDLDRAFRIFNNSINGDNIKQEINKLAENLNTRVHLNDFNEFKENLSNINSTISFLKDTISQLSEDRKILDDFNWLKKKVENLTSSITNMRPEDSNTSNSKHMQMDYSKYLDLNTYNEFTKAYNKDLDKINWRLDELKYIMDDVVANTKNKVSDKDLKTLEEYLTAKIEEIRINTQRKYADRNETSKNIKYLDSQIKHITEVYIKKMEKGDNWLLASKPIGGYKCASCESYLGDLNDKNTHLPWNKIPNRDPSERLYRVGNGFSRMLQMLNIDNVNKNSEEAEMASSQYKKDNQLPRVTDKHFHQSLYNIHSESINISADNIKIDGSDVQDLNKNQPKIVKIYKKNKEGKTDKKGEKLLDSKTKENKTENVVIKSLK